MTSTIEDFGYKDCGKIDGRCVKAYINLSLDENDPTKLILDSTWNDHDTIDLTPAIKAGETMTYVDLTPEDNPECFRYIGEDGQPQCISGDNFSRIIKMEKLRDVDQTQQIADGDCYVYNSRTGMFEPYSITNAISALSQRVAELEESNSQLRASIRAINLKLTPPVGTPANASVVFGNINLYSDADNQNSKDWGLYTHELNNDIKNDEYFA